MNYYQPNGYYNPYIMQQPVQMPQQNQIQNQAQQQIQRQEAFNTQNGLQGKSVDSIEVVKATDIPLDYSISYFPLTDGSAIVTKQLQQDGTSKMTVYKPIELKEEVKETSKYITEKELDEAMKKVNLKDDIKTIKKQIKNIVDDIDELKERND